jgi:hypothetical protein
MRIDETGEDVLPRRIDYLRARWRRKILPNRRDGLVLAENIGDVARVGRDDFAILDEE